ncbi:hypothetical protein J8273_8372 [Carpediemonas membranifera]|uniref:Uncharacterized protein n=1 Tax=Carpediemonas membranifera TaxID=201153 RepID=A0A8J6APN9_9EUKA|nr:hypothetical protein J8273_8372 [Carpediemonas membranifera]|eukprot:KAG9389698.1 hypothetical protein J8273_8372 [Carpediemonas membranifera]
MTRVIRERITSSAVKVKCRNHLCDVLEHPTLAQLCKSSAPLGLDSDLLSDLKEVFTVPWNSVLTTVEFIDHLMAIFALSPSERVQPAVVSRTFSNLDEYWCAFFKYQLTGAFDRIMRLRMLAREMTRFAVSYRRNFFKAPSFQNRITVKDCWELSFPKSAAIIWRPLKGGDDRYRDEIKAVQALINSIDKDLPAMLEVPADTYVSEMYRCVRMWHVPTPNPLAVEPTIKLKFQGYRTHGRTETEYTFVEPKAAPAPARTEPKKRKKPVETHIQYSEYESDSDFSEPAPKPKRSRPATISAVQMSADWKGRAFLPNCHWVSVEDYNRCRDLLFDLSAKNYELLHRSLIVDAKPFRTSGNQKTAPSVVQQGMVAEGLVYQVIGKGYYINHNLVAERRAQEGGGASQLNDFPLDFPPLTDALQKRQDKMKAECVKDWTDFKNESKTNGTQLRTVTVLTDEQRTAAEQAHTRVRTGGKRSR